MEMAEVVEGTQWTGCRGGGGSERSLAVGNKRSKEDIKKYAFQ